MHAFGVRGKRQRDTALARAGTTLASGKAPVCVRSTGRPLPLASSLSRRISNTAADTDALQVKARRAVFQLFSFSGKCAVREQADPPTLPPARRAKHYSIHVGGEECRAKLTVLHVSPNAQPSRRHVTRQQARGQRTGRTVVCFRVRLGNSRKLWEYFVLSPSLKQGRLVSSGAMLIRRGPVKSGLQQGRNVAGLILLSRAPFPGFPHFSLHLLLPRINSAQCVFPTEFHIF